MQLDNILENYKLNLPKQKQNSLVLDAGKQDLNSQNLVDNLKKLNISLILIDFSSIDYGFNLKSDLESKAKLIQEEGYYGLYRIN